jgi:serine phosphatase RsbU (regulator of sigma subunit)
MSVVGQKQRVLVECGVAGRPLEGQSVSGDLHVVNSFGHGVLLAVIDGVGHGEEASAAAKVAKEVLEKHAREPVISLLGHCHQAMAQTRGAVLTVASVNALDNTITWTGVGNVEGRLLRADASSGHPCESVLLRNGLVGLQLPALQAEVLPLAPGDLLIFVTDGIRIGFERNLNCKGSPQHIADQILHRSFKGTDDALVLTARYFGI